jgi:hypothetical protein
MDNTSHACRGQEGMVISMGMNNPEARRWNKSAAQCFADRWVHSSAVSPSFGRTFRHRLENRLAEVISDSSNDRNYRVVWSRMEILPTHVAWRPASPSIKGSNPPETHQSGSEQFEDVPRGVDVPVPEGCLASTVGTAQDVPGELEYDLHARELGRSTRRRAVRHSTITERVDPRTTWSNTSCTCPRGAGDQRRPRSFRVLSESVVTRRVMNEAQSCSIVPTLVAARTTKGRLGGSDANILLRRVETLCMGT